MRNARYTQPKFTHPIYIYIYIYIYILSLYFEETTKVSIMYIYSFLYSVECITTEVERNTIGTHYVYIYIYIYIHIKSVTTETAFHLNKNKY